MDLPARGDLLGPVRILALRTGLVRRARFWLFPLGVILGGLPDWIYEVLYYPTARLMLHQSGSLPAESLAGRSAQLFGDIALQLHGAAGMDGFVPPRPTQVAVMALGALALVRAVVRDRGELRWFAGAGGQPGHGLGLLWGVAAANVGLVLLTKRPIGAIYLMPLYSVLPIWTGECLWWLWCRRRWLGGSALAGLLVFHLWANWMVTLGRGPRVTSRWAPLHEAVGPLTDWLTARGIRHVYWAMDGGIASFEFTYLSGLRVVAAHLWSETVVQDAHAVDAEPAPPIVTTPDLLPELRASLRGLSLGLQETPVGGFVVIEASPTRPIGFMPIPPIGWTVTSSSPSGPGSFAWPWINRGPKRGRRASCSSTGPRRRPRRLSAMGSWPPRSAARACVSSMRATGCPLASASSRASPSAPLSRTPR